MGNANRRYLGEHDADQAGVRKGSLSVRGRFLLRTGSFLLYRKPPTA